jgi:hypothetical protein
VERSKNDNYGLSCAEIQQAECPRCGAALGDLCNWSKDKHLISAERQARQEAGRSHYERMAVAHGHAPQAAVKIAEANRAQEAGQELHPAIALVRCPEHDAPRGSRCPDGRGYCLPRQRKLMLVAVRRARRQRKLQAVS